MRVNLILNGIVQASPLKYPVNRFGSNTYILDPRADIPFVLLDAPRPRPPEFVDSDLHLSFLRIRTLFKTKTKNFSTRRVNIQINTHLFEFQTIKEMCNDAIINKNAKVEKHSHVNGK